MTDEFPQLAEGWEATRDTLHAYCRVVGVVPRAHATPQPRWLHVSLEVTLAGLATQRMDLPAGGVFWLEINLLHNAVILNANRGEIRRFSMETGLTATAFGEQLLGRLAESELPGDYERQKFADEGPRPYDPVAAGTFHQLISTIDAIFKDYRASLAGETGPVRLWPHHFDLAFELLGTRLVDYEHEGRAERLPAQLSFGFSPGDASHSGPYFYCNPWPFLEEVFMPARLPPGARLVTDGWQGSLMPYTALLEKPDPRQYLLDYFQTVHNLSQPTLFD
jgi:hypothetical protein